MKFELPDNHGLSESLQKNLLFRDDSGNPALSDIQFEALSTGVARGQSLLVVSPTSTGKTQIALWAIANGLEQSCNTVYLVTHRALAKQKFEDFKAQLMQPYLAGNAASLVVATGDYVEDAAGDIPSDPLQAPLLVATYEKYLALLSAGGVPKDMRNSVIVCDEIQLIGDEHRGQNVEVLLTLLRNAGWKQFVGLSAVLQPRDAHDLANWLCVQLVVQHTREKHLRYECWTNDRMLSVTSEHPERVNDADLLPKGTELDPISALISLLNEESPPLPIIVFCMKKQDTYDLAKRFVETVCKGAKGQMSLAFDGLPETSANAFLASILEHRVASHNADLMDEERHIVEQRLLDGKLDVVFATTTLAAGVNFPLGAAVFASWTRWDFNKKKHVPIEPAEFHNMAGRVGRMGFAHEHGRVIFFATNPQQVDVAKRYLALGELPVIEARVQPERFNQLALQLVASGLCSSRSEVERLVCTTFSALREENRNTVAFTEWPSRLGVAVDSLKATGFMVETSTGKLCATPVGKAVGYSGLLPETATFLLEYLVSKASNLVGLLPTTELVGNPYRLAFLVFSACLSSPEFRSRNGVRPTRALPYPLDEAPLIDADQYKDDLAEPVWHADIMPINAACLCCKWIEGAEIRSLEGTLPQLSAGMLRDLHRNLIWTLQGLAAIATAACDKRVPRSSRPQSLHVDDEVLEVLSKLPRALRRLSFRVSEGLPDDVLWMTSLCAPGAAFQLSRSEVLSLRTSGLGTPQSLMLGTKEADLARLKAFEKTKPNPQAKANWVRDACRDWKKAQRARAAERQVKRAKRCPRLDLIERFYKSTGIEFERMFEEVLTFLRLPFDKLDDKTKTGAPDYLLKLPDTAPLIVELKSKEEGKLVDYNKAVEVLAASEVHGHKETRCITLCHPGVDPSVPAVVASCGRLCVVESVDLGEALLRYCEGTLNNEQFYQWLATPGQALSADLPFRDYGV